MLNHHHLESLAINHPESSVPSPATSEELQLSTNSGGDINFNGHRVLEKVGIVNMGPFILLQNNILKNSTSNDDAVIGGVPILTQIFLCLIKLCCLLGP